MGKFKRLLKKIFCLPPLPTILIALPSLVLVFYMLANESNSSLLSYISYTASAYAMILLCTGFWDIVHWIRDGIIRFPLVKKLLEHPVGKRFFEDAAFRTRVSLYPSVLINLIYVAVKLFSGFYYHSLWFLALAGYYTLLVLMRFLLLYHFRKSEAGKDYPAEFRRYRACGIMLLFMNQALMVIVIFIVDQNRGYEYPGVLIYAMAVYAFYAIITAIINAVKYRRYGSPVLSATKIINLTAALVSMLSLETAMLARFGGDESVFRQVMTASTGGAVCLIVLTMAIFMIVRSTRRLKKIRDEASGK